MTGIMTGVTVEPVRIKEFTPLQTRVILNGSCPKCHTKASLDKKLTLTAIKVLQCTNCLVLFYLRTS